MLQFPYRCGLVLSLLSLGAIQAQDSLPPSPAVVYTFQTFKDTRIINTPSIEVLPARQMDFRVSHRFGDMFGAAGGWQSFYGLENASDILIGFDYGLLPNLNLSFNRTKGAGPLNRLLNGSVKYKILSQTEGKGSPMPVSLTGMATLSLSTMKGVEGSAAQPSLAEFNRFSHRLIYGYELLLARKFSPRLSMQASATMVWRNLVAHDEANALWGLGWAARIQCTKVLSLILDTQLPLNANYLQGRRGFQPPLGLGLEFETGGHVFQINWTNARALSVTDYFPHSQSRWERGEFRLGFTISRRFRV